LVLPLLVHLKQVVHWQQHQRKALHHQAWFFWHATTVNWLSALEANANFNQNT
jgi:hypothetical protein